MSDATGGETNGGPATTAPPLATAERRHPVDGAMAEPGTTDVPTVGTERPGPTAELYQFELWSATGTEAVALRVELWTWPAQRQAWFAAHLFRPGSALVTLTEQAPLRSGLELRASGLWADHNIEIPFEHWSLGLEAFALEVDHPTDERGLRVPLGYELDWEMQPTQRRATVGGYEQPARVRGELLVGADRYELDADGWRGHRQMTSLPTQPQHHGRMATDRAQAATGGVPSDDRTGDGLVWSLAGEEPAGQRWGWAATNLPFGMFASAPWFDGVGPGVTGFAERWSPAP